MKKLGEILNRECLEQFCKWLIKKEEYVDVREKYSYTSLYGTPKRILDNCNAGYIWYFAEQNFTILKSKVQEWFLTKDFEFVLEKFKITINYKEKSFTSSFFWEDDTKVFEMANVLYNNRRDIDNFLKEARNFWHLKRVIDQNHYNYIHNYSKDIDEIMERERLESVLEEYEKLR